MLASTPVCVDSPHPQTVPVPFSPKTRAVVRDTVFVGVLHLDDARRAYPDLDGMESAFAALAAALLDLTGVLHLDADPFVMAAHQRPADSLFAENLVALVGDLRTVGSATTDQGIAQAVAQTLVNLDAVASRYGLNLYAAVGRRDVA